MKYVTLFFAMTGVVLGQQVQKKQLPPFSWVSPAPESRLEKFGVNIPNLEHHTFRSHLVQCDVGYHIYLPDGYTEDISQRYPVVYYLHGGRPGGEYKSVNIAKYVHEAIQEGEIEPTIYVFPNGGPVSWYDFKNVKQGLGESVFVLETIAHIDKKYRTIAKREGRGIEGFSQGGRGTTRIWLKHPELFISAAPGGAGYGPEMDIRDNNGLEKSGTRITPSKNNTWDLLDIYASQEETHKIEPMFWVGKKGQNFETNLLYMEKMDEHKLDFHKVLAEGVGHSARGIYELHGDEILNYHQQRFERP